MVLLNNNENKEDTSTELENFLISQHNKTHLFRWLNIFLTQLQFSFFSRLMILVLTIISNGRESFACPYAVIAKQLIKEKDPDITENDITQSKTMVRQTIRRRLNALEKEQKKNNFSFFKWDKGHQYEKNGKIVNVPTQFNTLFYEMFKEDLELVEKELSNHKNFFAAMDHIFTEEIKKRIESTRPTLTAKKQEPLSQKEKKYNTIQKQVNSLLKNLNALNILESELSQKEVTQIKGELLSPLLDTTFINKENITAFREFIQKIEKKHTLCDENKNDTYSLITKGEKKGERESITKSFFEEERGGVMNDTPVQEISALDVPFEGKGLLEIICIGCKQGFLEVNENDLCDSCNSMLDESQQMIMLFDSVGVCEIDFNMRAFDPGHVRGIGNNIEYIKKCLPDSICSFLKEKVLLNFEGKAHVFFRPHNTEDIVLIQLDDVKEKSIEILKDKAFLTICTSPNNYQCWIAIEAKARATEKDFTKFIKKGFWDFFAEQDQVDVGATNSIRACSKNLKPKYAPDFPVVTIVNNNYGRILSLEEVRELGINVDFEEVVKKEKKKSEKIPSFSEKEVKKSPSPPSLSFCEYSSFLNTKLRKPFPHYWKTRNYCFFVENGKLKNDGTGKDFSAIDFGFACQKLKEGEDPHLIEQEIRERATGRGKYYSYAKITVISAQKELIKVGVLEEI